MSGYHLNWGGIGPTELAIVLVVIFILFGHHLPRILFILFRPRGPWL